MGDVEIVVMVPAGRATDSAIMGVVNAGIRARADIRVTRHADDEVEIEPLVDYEPAAEDGAG